MAETQAGYPYVSIALRVIDNYAKEILNEKDNAFYPLNARFYLVSSKTGKTNAFAVNSLRHTFPDWDDSLAWFEGKHYIDEWFTVSLKATQDGSGYDVEYLYPLNGQPYKLDRPDVSALSQKWDKFLKAVPRQGEQQQQTPPPNQSVETNVLPKKAIKGSEDDDPPF